MDNVDYSGNDPRNPADKTARRLDDLEKQCENAFRFYKCTLTVIGLVFVVAALVIGVISIISGIEVNKTIREADRKAEVLESEVTEAIRGMERRFEVLAGTALRAPRLEIAHKGQTFGNNIIEGISDQGMFYVPGLYITNEGDRVAEPLSIRLYFSENVFCSYWSRMDWNRYRDEGYKMAFISQSHFAVKLDPHDQMPLMLDQVQYPKGLGGDISLRVEIFYGQPEPARADYVIRLKPSK